MAFELKGEVASKTMKRAAVAAMALYLIWFTSEAHGQVVGESASHRVADAYARGYFGGNQLVGEHPNGYEDFLVLWVEQCRNSIGEKNTKNTRDRRYPDSSVRMAVCGRVVFKGLRFPKGESVADGKYLWYEFNEAYLNGERPVRLIFDTQAVEGVRYHFEGIFVENNGKKPDQRAHLEGLMSRLAGDQKTTDTKLRFSPYDIIE